MLGPKFQRRRLTDVFHVAIVGLHLNGMACMHTKHNMHVLLQALSGGTVCRNIQLLILVPGMASHWSEPRAKCSEILVHG